jgi:tetratricopeptide (TPR) repeat protein/serine/threonine protein kinase
VTLEDIFLAAVEKAPADRAAYLDAACGSDAELRAQAEALLRSHEEAGSLLEQPLFRPGPTVDQPPAAEQPGVVIGPYKLIQPIGEGGMGTVWMAQQTEPVKRLVAVKLIKAGMDSRQVIARFEAERQALALMDHANIARVLDAGATGAGRPYFVMDLVKGEPITRYCDEHRLTPRQRLELFLPVCQAVQHAHQKGVIHRDLKPSNVLVARYDGKAVPKVIDFGVAKAAGQSLTEKTLVTGFGEVVGTLEYMSPEQAELNQLDIDTRSDVYALGVLLYELLAGSPPFTRKESEQGGVLEVLRLIREQEPTRPSTKLSTADGLPSLAANRGTEPAKLTRLVRGELDWIVMKALEKDRNRRYETANGFALDVQRYLADEPVLACPPSVGYRLGKFARRNKRALVMVAVLAVAVLVVAAALGWVVRDHDARRTRIANDFELAVERAELFHSQGKRAEALAAFERAEALAGEASLDSALQHKLVGLRERLDAEARDQEFIAQFEEYRLLEQTLVDEKINRFSYTGAAIHKALKRYGIEPGVTDLAQAVARIRGRPKAIQGQLLAALQDDLNRTPKDWVSTREWLIAALDSADRDPWRTQARRAKNTGNMPALEKLVREVDVQEQPASFLLWIAASWGLYSGTPHLELFRRIHRAHPNDIWANENLAQALTTAGQPAQAVRYYTAALALRPRNPGILFNRGNALRDAGEIAAAIADYSQAITVAPRYTAAHINLSQLLYGQGKLEEATLCYGKAIELKPDWANTWRARGNTYRELRQYDKALADYSKAIALKPDYPAAWNDRGIVYNRLQLYAKAIADYSKAIELKPEIPKAWYNRAGVYFKLRQYAKAIADYSKVIELDPADAEAWYNRGVVYGIQHRNDKALAGYSKAIELKPDWAEAWFKRANVLGNLGQYDKAVADRSKAIELKPDWAEAWYCRGIDYSNLGQYDKAVADNSKAIELKPDFAEAHCNLGKALQRQGRFADALAAMRRGHELGSKRTGWPYASAQWVQECKRCLQLDAKLPAVLRGEHVPNRDEAAELLQLCVWQRRYATAAVFAEKANSDRKEPIRLLGALAAALAGCGQAKDAAQLSDKERAHLRRRALDWLRADLAAWKARLATDQPKEREAAQRFLSACLRAPELASVREAKTLELLPAAERHKWRRFWAEVTAASLDKASTKP